MNILGLPIFVSLVLVAGAVVLFVHGVRQRDHEHADRLSLSPLDDDLGPSNSQEPSSSSSRNGNANEED
jgi:hypothetical protein